MRIAVTGASGFVGGALVERLRAAGHDVVPISRRHGIDVQDGAALKAAFVDCEAVAHCAGINREIGTQTYARVHVAGTRAVVDAAEAVGVHRVVLVSFLRARPDGPTTYHRSKWQAETIVRGSSLDWTVLKPGVIHGRGDHLLDHVSRAFRTFPVFGLVGLRGRARRLIAPIAVQDLARVLEAAATGDPRLARRTLAVLGPETLTLDAAMRRVGEVVGRRTWFVPLPMRAMIGVGWLAERVMRVPLLAVAQAHILIEGVTEPAPGAEVLPEDLAPSIPFSVEVIQAGLPEPIRFGRADLRCCRSRSIDGGVA